MFGLLAGGGVAAAAEDPGTNITVEVTAPATPAPSTTPSSSAPSGTGGSGGSGSKTPSTTTTRPSDGGSAVVTSVTNPPELAADEVSLGGVLYLSGLSTEYGPSIDPLGGELKAHLTVRNVSTETIDSTARFWITNVFGAEISSVDGIAVAGLKPDESTTVDATLNGVGQWTFATAHVTLTPPETVAGTTLEPMTRDAVVFLPPWFIVGLAVIGAIAFAVRRIVRYVSGSPVIGVVAAGRTA